MDVSIIIVNYNTKGLTNSCIDSVRKFTEGLEYEIILVDNASTDGSKEFFCNRDDIKYIYLQENLGFGKGNNAALPYVTGRNVLFLNSDTLLINNAIKILSDYLDNNIDVSACGGNLYNAVMEPTLSFERYRLSIKRELNKLLRYIPLKICYGRNRFFNFGNTVLSVGYVSGADLMVRKKDIDEVGCFSPDFFMYYEEVELQERLSMKGKIASVPQAKIQHLEGAATKNSKTTFNARKCRWMYESEMIYLKKHKNKFETFLIWSLEMILVSSKILCGLITNDKQLLSDKKHELQIINDVCNARQL